jgi:hypothetical protein
MKVIFSRKGFDSSFGEKPSPIFPDGRMVSLPIPEEMILPIRFNCIRWQEYNIGTLVSGLPGGKNECSDPAHLDPDLRQDAIKRVNTKGWRPCFGQEGSAQGHLHGKDVGKDALFLFFGLFQEVEQSNGRWCYKKTPLHVLWGWLLVDKVLGAETLKNSPPPWAKEHPHVVLAKELKKNNTLYIATETLASLGFPNKEGGGVFKKFKPSLQLTAPGRTTRMWKLPRWFYPKNSEQALSYHPNIDKSWEKYEDHVILKSAAPGQEFVLDSKYYPELEKWVIDLFSGE